MSLESLMIREIDLVNRTLADHNVDAGTRPAWTLIAASSFIAYGVRLGRGERIANVEKCLPELTENLSASRGSGTPVRLRRLPLALEVPHPHPQPLPHVRRDLPAHTMLLGRSYGFDGAHDETMSFDETPHALIAGMTGAGKSVLLAEMLLSLTRNTSPADLRLVLVDLKNEDLVPFAKLPHVLRFAGSLEDARAAVDFVHEVKEERRRTRQRPFRLVLAVDELAELAPASDALAQLGSVLSVGRSMRVNVLAATQHPLAKVVGSVGKVNFPVRLVGMVSDATAASVATGRPATGAEFLPGRGAFLRVQSADVVRFQSYFVTPADIRTEIRVTRGHWPTVGQTSSTLPTLPNMPSKLVDVFREYANGDGLRRGGMAAALRALYGHDAPTSGRAYQDAVSVVNEHFQTWQNTSGDTSGDASGKASGSILPREKRPEVGISEISEVKFWM